MVEGQLQKRIEKWKEHYAKILVGSPISMNAVYLHIENLLENLKKDVGEMRKDFPQWYLYKGTVYLRKELTDAQLKEATFYSADVDQKEFTKWFVKWLGEDQQ